MIEVTRENFTEILPTLETRIRAASCVGFDAEYTALTIGTENETR